MITRSPAGRGGSWCAALPAETAVVAPALDRVIGGLLAARGGGCRAPSCARDEGEEQVGLPVPARVDGDRAVEQRGGAVLRVVFDEGAAPGYWVLHVGQGAGLSRVDVVPGPDVELDRVPGRHHQAGGP